MPYLGKQPTLSAATTADLGDDIVTLAKLAGGTDGNIISFDASGDPVAIATGSDGQVLTSAGAGAPPAFEAAGGGGFTLGTEQATTSGTSVTFGSIPAGTTMIVINFEDVSFSGGVALDVTIGDAGGLETSGYNSCGKQFPGTSVQSIGSTAEFIAYGTTSGAEYTISGQMILTLKDSSDYTWMSSHSFITPHVTTTTQVGAGEKALSAELTQVSISGGTFDGGSINIMYQ